MSQPAADRIGYLRLATQASNGIYTKKQRWYLALLAVTSAS